MSLSSPAVFLCAALVATAEPNTAVISRSLLPDEAASLHSACGAHFSCAPPERVAEALADAVGLGISCADDDVTCWQRFLAAEGFARAIVAARRATTTRVLLITLDQAPATAEAASGAAALEGILTPASSTPGAPASARSASQLGPPETSVPAPLATDGALVPWVVAGAASVVAIGAGVGATIISVDLANSLDAAQAREAPLVDYDLRSGLFFSLATASGVAALTAAAAGTVALQSGDP